jgi:hypothetical protein
MGESCKTLREGKKYTILVRKPESNRIIAKYKFNAKIILKSFLLKQVVILRCDGSRWGSKRAVVKMLRNSGSIKS